MGKNQNFGMLFLGQCHLHPCLYFPSKSGQTIALRCTWTDKEGLISQFLGRKVECNRRSGTGKGEPGEAAMSIIWSHLKCLINPLLLWFSLIISIISIIIWWPALRVPRQLFSFIIFCHLWDGSQKMSPPHICHLSCLTCENSNNRGSPLILKQFYKPQLQHNMEVAPRYTLFTPLKHCLHC